MPRIVWSSVLIGVAITLVSQWVLTRSRTRT